MKDATGNARPLSGRRVLVTRPRAQAAELVQQLEAAGAEVLVAPTIRIVPPLDRSPLLRAAAEASRFDWIVFPSANAVDAFLSALEEVHGTTAGAKVCAVGSRTAQRLTANGVAVDLVPAEFRAEAVVNALGARGALGGTRVLLPRADIGRRVIADGLQTAGADVTEVVAYRTVAEDPSPDAPDVRTILAAGALDAVTFTSGSAVRSFVQMHGDDVAALLATTAVAVIGPVTADAARELGIPVHVQPETYTTAALVDALQAYFDLWRSGD